MNNTMNHHLSNDNESSSFQVLYFETNGLLLAAPLVELGGIHRKGQLNHLVGKPDWHLGLQTINSKQCSVIDTSKWIGEGKETENKSYEYIIVLGNSQIGLACHSLKGTETITKDQVKWNTQNKKHKWFSGIVKDKMCALIEPQEMIQLLTSKTTQEISSEVIASFTEIKEIADNRVAA